MSPMLAASYMLMILYESNSGMRHDRGYFNVSNGGKIHVKGTSRLTDPQGNVSGEGSQVNS